MSMTIQAVANQLAIPPKDLKRQAIQAFLREQARFYNAERLRLCQKMRRRFSARAGSPGGARKGGRGGYPVRFSARGFPDCSPANDGRTDGGELMTDLGVFQRIAETDFADIVVGTRIIDAKLRVLISLDFEQTVSANGTLVAFGGIVGV